MSDYPGGFNPPSDNPPGGPNPGGQGGYNSPNPYGQPQGGSGQPVPPPAQFSGGSGSGARFDLSLIAPGGLIAAVGGLLFLVFSFFPWYTLEWLGSVNAWHRASSEWSVIIFGLVTVAFGGKALRVVPRKIQLEIIALGLVFAGDLFFLFAFFNGVASPISRGFGLWMDLLVVIAINVGAVLQFLKVGGLASAQRGLGNVQQRAAGGYPQQPGPGGFPQQPGPGGYPQQPDPGGFPPQGGPQ
jgi:hypothetical protein